MTKLSKKARKQMNNVSIDNGVPPKIFLISLLSDSLRLLSGIGCGEYSLEEREVNKDIFQLCSTIDSMLSMIKDSDVAQAELKCEQELDFHRIVSSLDDDVMQELVEKFKKDTGKTDDSGIQKIIKDVKSLITTNKD